jgi:hypothetical protein
MVVGDWDGRIALAAPPLPAEGTAERVRLAVEVLTGMALDTRQTARRLSPDELEERRGRLGALEGMPAAFRGGGRPE